MVEDHVLVLGVSVLTYGNFELVGEKLPHLVYILTLCQKQLPMLEYFLVLLNFEGLVWVGGTLKQLISNSE